MGRSTIGVIPQRVDIDGIKDRLTKTLGVKLNIEKVPMDDFHILIFEYKGEERALRVSIDEYEDKRKKGKEKTTIEMCYWGSSVEIIEGVLEGYGGDLCRIDIEENWETVKLGG